MKKLSKVIVGSLVLGTIISSSFIGPAHAASSSTLETQNKIEYNAKNDAFGADKFLAPMESYTLTVTGTTAALFTIMPYTQPNTVHIEISDSKNVFFSEAFVDLRGEYNHYLHGMNPSTRYHLKVTNLSTSTLPVGMLITPGELR